MARWVFESDDALMVELDALIAEGGLTRKEFTNAALTMMKWAISHIKQNHPIAAIDEVNRKYRELQMAELDRYRPQ
jgi:hypothetical protein